MLFILCILFVVIGYQAYVVNFCRFIRHLPLLYPLVKYLFVPDYVSWFIMHYNTVRQLICRLSSPVSSPSSRYADKQFNSFHATLAKCYFSRPTSTVASFAEFRGHYKAAINPQFFMAVSRTNLAVMLMRLQQLFIFFCSLGSSSSSFLTKNYKDDFQLFNFYQFLRILGKQPVTAQFAGNAIYTNSRSFMTAATTSNFGVYCDSSATLLQNLANRKVTKDLSSSTQRMFLSDSHPGFATKNSNVPFKIIFNLFLLLIHSGYNEGFFSSGRLALPAYLHLLVKLPTGKGSSGSRAVTPPFVRSSNRSTAAASYSSAFKYQFSVLKSWANFINFFFFFRNLYAYGVFLLFFGRLTSRLTITYLNWAHSGNSLCGNNAGSINKCTIPPLQLFAVSRYCVFFKFFKLHSLQFLQWLINYTGVELFFFFDSAYHFHAIRFCANRGIRSVGLTNIAVEPWLLWYPIFCNGSSFIVQYTFSFILLQLI